MVTRQFLATAALALICCVAVPAIASADAPLVVSESIHSSEPVTIDNAGPVVIAAGVRIEAPAITITGGTVRIEGSLIAPRGRITAVGERVDLAGAHVDGRAIYLGDKKTTRYTTVDGDSTIDAGDGGHIELWSSELTSMRGTAIARAGYIETSSLGVIDTAYAHYDASGGALVFDPHNITVVAGAGQTGGTLAAGNFTPTADSSTIGADDIKAALDANTSVTLDTGSGGAQLGDIAVNANISTTSATAGLTLTAANKITLNNSIALNGGSLSMRASGTLGNGGGITQPGGTITGAGTTTVQTTTSTDAKLDQANNDFGTVTVAGQVADVTFVDQNSIVLGDIAANGLVTITAPGGITQTGTLLPGSTYILTADDTHDITLSDASNNFIGLEIVDARNVTVTDANSITLDDFTAKGTADVTTSGAIAQTASDSMTIGGTLTLNSNSSGITLGNSINDFATVVATNSGSVTLGDTNGLALGTMSVPSLTVTAAGNVTQSGVATVVGTTTIDAGATHDVTFNNGSNSLGTFAAPNAKDVVVVDSDAGGLTLRNGNITGDLNATSGGQINDQFGQSLTVAGTATLTATSAPVTMDSNHDFGAVAASGTDVTINDVNALILGAITATGSLNVSAGGALSQNADATVTGTTTAAGAPVNLSRQGNAFTGVVAVTSTGGGSALVRGAGDVALGSSSSGGGLTAQAADDLALSGTINATGPLMLVADAQNASPAIGSGGVSIAGGTALTGSGAVRLYGAHQADNSVAANATINGSTFTQGAHFVPSAREQYGVFTPGGTATAPFTFFYKEADATTPTAPITTPAEGAAYERASVVNASYSCSDSGSGAGVTSCAGNVPSGSPVDTATLGAKTFTVTATTGSGRTTTSTVHYNVVDTTKPTISLPSIGRVPGGRVGTLTFSCADETQLVSCTGSVPSGSPLDTATVGTKTLTVTAVDGSGNTRTSSATYEVFDAGACKLKTATGTAFGDHIVGLGRRRRVERPRRATTASRAATATTRSPPATATTASTATRATTGIDGGAGDDHFLRGDAGNDRIDGRRRQTTTSRAATATTCSPAAPATTCCRAARATTGSPAAPARTPTSAAPATTRSTPPTA